jgi:hypothetical protein
MSVRVIVVMPVMIIMGVLTSMMMVMMPMMVVVRIPMRMGATVGLERHRYLNACKPVLRHQSFGLGPLLQPDPVGENLHRDVAIAQRQDEARHSSKILGAHLEHWFDVGHNLDEAAVIEHQEVIGVQARRRRKIELDACPPAPEHESLLPAAVIELQQQRIDDLAD